MNESFLRFIWRQGLFDQRNLCTTDGLPVRILSPGISNPDAGPDFFDARIWIGETLWAGNVEIHKRSSDWKRHRHDRNAAYDNVILHVVAENDRPVRNFRGQIVPALCLVYPEYLEANYLELLHAEDWIACEKQLHCLDRVDPGLWLHRLMVERLQGKTGEILLRLKENKNDWNETFYQFLARNFGFRANALPFELTARNLPLRIAGRHRDKLFSMEALYFGTAGMLQQNPDCGDYASALYHEYTYLRRKYQLTAVPGHLWKFLRLRPLNFPSIRLAQFAALIFCSDALFSRIIETGSLDRLRVCFRVKASSYWDTHFRFDRLSPECSKSTGRALVDSLIVNTVVPFLFVYGNVYHKEELKDRALQFLEQLPAESNVLIRHWKELGIQVDSAFESQALIQLKNRYCIPRRCPECFFGAKLIRLNR
ncbi:MAG: DUF2851 family protein [Mangrovibacterium sp.]